MIEILTIFLIFKIFKFTISFRYIIHVFTKADIKIFDKIN